MGGVGGMGGGVGGADGVVVADQVTEVSELVQILGPEVGLVTLYVPAQLCPAQSAMTVWVGKLPGTPWRVSSQWPFVICGAGRGT